MREKQSYTLQLLSALIHISTHEAEDDLKAPLYSVNTVFFV